jgi:hypothetical protein
MAGLQRASWSLHIRLVGQWVAKSIGMTQGGTVMKFIGMFGKLVVALLGAAMLR